MITPSKLAAVSALSGFKNYLSSSFFVAVPAQNLGAFSFISFAASTPLNNANSISQVQVQYSGLSNSDYIINGTTTTLWSGGNLEVQSYYYFDGTNLNVFTVIVNLTAGVVAVPAITINCRGFLFLAPF